jgi:uroporphyrinogen decarboxylase
MSHRERARRAFAFQDADRVPLDIGGLSVTSLHLQAEAQLKAALGFEGGRPRVGSFTMQSALVDERILRRFDADFRCLHAQDGNGWRANGDGHPTDEYGITYRRSPDGLYYDFLRHPLAEADLAEIERYRFADPRSEGRVAGFAETIEQLGGEFPLVLEGLRDTIFGVSSWVRGIEQFYMDLAEDSPIADALLEKVTEHQIGVLDFILGRFGRHIDYVRIADDLGSQTSLLISPATYRRKIKPLHARLVRAIKDRCDCKVVIHSDGAVRELLPDFIEVGIDALNPVQVSCTGMEPRGLKSEFGRRLVFWGGGVDTQQVLRSAVPEEVRQAVREALRDFGHDGGYVFAQVHNVQPDVPVASILAMYEAFHEAAARVH